MLANEREELLGIASLADDVETCSIEQARQAFAQEDLVVRNDNAVGARGLLANLRLHESHYPSVSPLVGKARIKRLPAPPHGSRFTLAAMAPGDDGRRLDGWLRRPFVIDGNCDGG